MGREQPIRMGLRAATSDAHERVDRAFSVFDLADRESYGRFLQAQAAAFLPLEAALDSGAGPRLPLDWPARRRTEALLADLHALGIAPRDAPRLSPIEDIASALGTLYVLEGSRLGGALLRRSVDPAFSAGFLSPAPSGLWRELLDVLEATITSDDKLRAATVAARFAFGLFEDSARALGRDGRNVG